MVQNLNKNIDHFQENQNIIVLFDKMFLENPEQFFTISLKSYGAHGGALKQKPLPLAG
jgi:hypothetical protein